METGTPVVSGTNYIIVIQATNAARFFRLLQQSPDAQLQALPQPADFVGQLRPYQLRGLQWLALHQSRVGHWSATNNQYPTAMTAMAGIAMLCEGSTPNQGKYAPNGILQGAAQLSETAGLHAEDVAFDSESRMYVGSDRGCVFRFSRKGEGSEVFAVTGGRPLGLAITGTGDLVVADLAWSPRAGRIDQAV